MRTYQEMDVGPVSLSSTKRMRAKRTSVNLLMSFLVSYVVELAIAEMACVSRNTRRTLHVPSGVPVQRSISERDCSHPVVVELEKAETTSTSQNIRTTASSPLRYSGPVIRFLTPFLVSFI